MKPGKSKVETEFEFNPERMRRVRRENRHRATREETELRNCKVRVTMYLDGDVVEYFKRRAAAPDAAGYQTQINQALRSFLTAAGAENDSHPLLGDERFLDAVAERVRTRIR